MSGKKKAKFVSIEHGWKSYRRAVIPKGASRVQVSECRQAFFSGALILFQGIMGSLDEGDEPTEDEMARLDRIDEELSRFGQQVDARYGFGRN